MHRTITHGDLTVQYRFTATKNCVGVVHDWTIESLTYYCSLLSEDIEVTQNYLFRDLAKKLIEKDLDGDPEAYFEKEYVSYED